MQTSIGKMLLMISMAGQVGVVAHVSNANADMKAQANIHTSADVKLHTEKSAMNLTGSKKNGKVGTPLLGDMKMRLPQRTSLRFRGSIKIGLW